LGVRFPHPAPSLYKKTIKNNILEFCEIFIHLSCLAI
jgi:hypothetical protein